MWAGEVFASLLPPGSSEVRPHVLVSPQQGAHPFVPALVDTGAPTSIFPVSFAKLCNRRRVLQEVQRPTVMAGFLYWYNIEEMEILVANANSTSVNRLLVSAHIITRKKGLALPSDLKVQLGGLPLVLGFDAIAPGGIEIEREFETGRLFCIVRLALR